MHHPSQPEEIVSCYKLASRYHTSKGWQYIKLHGSTVNKSTCTSAVVLSFTAGAGTGAVKGSSLGPQGSIIFGAAGGLAAGFIAYHVAPYVSSRLSNYPRWNAISASQAITLAAVNHLKSHEEIARHLCPLLGDFPHDPVKAPDGKVYSLKELQALPLNKEGRVTSPATNAKFWIAECRAYPLSRVAVLEAQLKAIEALLKDEKIASRAEVRESLNNGRNATIIDLEEECLKALS